MFFNTLEMPNFSAIRKSVCLVAFNFCFFNSLKVIVIFFNYLCKSKVGKWKVTVFKILLNKLKPVYGSGSFLWVD